ncbi:hypothetical protein JDN40_04230 [Rhodomicrobium vannielii ATCC 17100]|uniref:hypothetical protein n=1 Tax=Rhodomicrobium vannielii TaxID=1069 RepID=UPI00191A7E16|nr:hypothetical protein [Rhodomicrobium vannielii]MBJ7533315.1 hypothetical protein [Rhodomicrobium vannielii ATCC 17100]
MTDDPIPRNISMTLRFIRESSALSLRRMADELNKTSGRKIPGRRGRPAKFDHDLIEAIESQERLKIWHLGRYANWYGMPVGAILLFSQLASHIRDGKREDVELTKSVAEAVKHVCEYVIENADALAAGVPDTGAADQRRDRKLEALVRECAFKNADVEQRRQDARLVSAIHQIMNQYALTARKSYRDHSDRKFNSPTDDSET